MATTHFENVDLLKSLMGGGRPQVPASRHPAPAAAATSPPPPPAAAPLGSDNRLSHDALGISPASTRPTTARSPGPQREAPPPRTNTQGSGGAPPPYQTHAPPAPPGREAPPPPSAASAGAGSVRTVSTPSSPALSLASLPGYEAQPPPALPPPSAAPSLPSSQASSGLKALFQVPVPLGFREAGKAPPRPLGDAAPPPTPRRQSAPPPNRGGPEPPTLSPMPSVASFRSLVAEGGGAISELEGDSCLLLPPRPASYSAGASPGSSVRGPRRISSPLPQAGAAVRHGGRSQFFVYKPRQPPTVLVADAITESPADTPVFELDGSGVCRPPCPPCTRLVESPEEGEEDAGEEATGPRGEEKPRVHSAAADASGEASQVPGRRNEVESAAWHRRTKMFQV